MCGICGQLRFDGRPADSELVLRMRETLKHRGPDDQGLYDISFDRGGLAMGHTRLAILDLTAAGHQPMMDTSGRYHIVLNGEVYNYLELRKDLERRDVEFRSHSDTEVVLAAYARFGRKVPADVQRHVCAGDMGRDRPDSVLRPGPPGGQAVLLQL